MRGTRQAWALGALVLTLGIGGCGDDAPQRASAPRDEHTYARNLFREICAGCHTLADAGTHGIRSDIDDSVLGTIDHPSRVQVARDAMSSQGSGGGYMPRWKGVLTERDFEALVMYIADVTGRRRRT